MTKEVTFKRDIKRFYVSGKISGMRIDWAKQNFHFACLEVQKYHEADFVVNPFDIKPIFGFRKRTITIISSKGTEYKHHWSEFYKEKWMLFMIPDILAQRKCTHSAFQQNWKDSKRAVIEYFFAKFVFKHEIIFL